ncbi:MAG: hypothetical protein JXQ73_21675 [Phycisphaerae bacterium]|nr:hypothetical protein [Phycisphaerae bacterium]
MKYAPWLCLLSAMLSGCSHADSSYAPADRGIAAPTESLFPGDEAAMEGASIERILNVKVTVPKPARLAILHFGQRGPWRWWSEEFARMDDDLQKGLLDGLRNCPRISEASMLPSLIMPAKQTVPNLRLAAARFQADLLLVYRTQSRVYDKQRFLHNKEVKARVVIEAVILDVRTGLIPFASAAAQEYQTEVTKDDFGIEETAAKAEMKAVSAALAQIGADVVKFLDKVP